MNIVILKGNVVRDPELKYFESNGQKVPVVNLTIATSRFYKKNDGSTAKDVTFTRCEAFDSGAETIAKLFKKGSPILVEGSLRNYNWEKDGQKMQQDRVRINTFEKLDRSPQTEGSGDAPQDSQPQEQQPAAAGVGAGKGDDDIPF